MAKTFTVTLDGFERLQQRLKELLPLLEQAVKLERGVLR